MRRAFFKLGTLENLAQRVGRSASTLRRWRSQGIPKNAREDVQAALQRAERSQKAATTRKANVRRERRYEREERTGIQDKPVGAPPRRTPPKTPSKPGGAPPKRTPPKTPSKPGGAPPRRKPPKAPTRKEIQAFAIEALLSTNIYSTDAQVKRIVRRLTNGELVKFLLDPTEANWKRQAGNAENNYIDENGDKWNPFWYH